MDGDVPIHAFFKREKNIMKSSSVISLGHDPVTFEISKLLAMKSCRSASIHIMSTIDHALHFIASQAFGASKMTFLLDLDMPDLDGTRFIGEFEKLSQSVKEKVQIYVLGSISKVNEFSQQAQSSSIENHFQKQLLLGQLQVMQRC